MHKYVYSFGDGNSEGNVSQKKLLGGKGANLAEMSKIGIPIPLGFTISTEVCDYYYRHSKTLPKDLESQVNNALQLMENKLNLKFGSKSNPLLVSVRSGSSVSMPGMMDTILNLGLNDDTVQGLIASSNDERFAYDCYRRFIQMYSDVVIGIDHFIFEETIANKKINNDLINDSELTATHLKELVEEFKSIVKTEANKDFPQDVNEQLWEAINAVFNSWNSNRAVTYRKINNINGDLGTAVNIQSMVFGNMGNDSATGVAFTRNPVSGENKIYGEFLINAQGEDVVAGIRTPQNISLEGKIATDSTLPSLEEQMPDIYQQLIHLSQLLEKHYGDMQDIEFTVQKQKLWILQTRAGKRTAKAAMRIAVDMVNEGKIDKENALCKINPLSLDQILHPTLDPKAEKKVIGKGLPASPGAVSGKIVFSADEAEKQALHYKVILVRVETSPEDIHGMHAAEGILTCRGGMTSHAAVVARGMGKCCISGASNITINYKEKTLIAGNVKLQEGDVITLNGSTGEIMLGEVKTIKPELSGDFATIMGWAQKYKTLKVRANAETPHDSKIAREFGAEGIGLCRTEHMFFDDARIMIVRQMILANDKKTRQSALNKLLPYQQNDFIEIFKIMEGLPVNIRLLDPPLHEFLPHSEKDIEEIAKANNLTTEFVRNRLFKLKEENPMLGHRGCRLGITYPEIYEMQALAIFNAMIDIIKLDKKSPIVEVMIPLITCQKEFKIVKEIIDGAASQIMRENNIKLNYQVGTMIEIPSAALRADEIAIDADYFSFGTNDLTQTTLGISRDDSGTFMPDYINNGIFDSDPFVKIDENSVGKLINMAVELGKNTKPNLKIGICGEHGGNPESIEFFNSIGLDYISCSPFRVPIAILSAAQSSIKFHKR